MSNSAQQMFIDKIMEIDRTGRVLTTKENTDLFFEMVKLACNPRCLVIHGHEFCIREKSNATQEDWRKEEDEMNARESLESIVDEKDHPFMKEAKLDTWQKRLMYFLKPVARHFKVDDESLLQRYMRHNLPTHAMEAGLSPLPFIQMGEGKDKNG